MSDGMTGRVNALSTQPIIYISFSKPAITNYTIMPDYMFVHLDSLQPISTEYIVGSTKEDFEVIYKSPKIEIFEEEAEQSRLMMAISAGD